jgi:hypothetical protein
MRLGDKFSKFEAEWPHRERDPDWEILSRSSKLAACLWPSLIPKGVQQQMRDISHGEGKRSPLEAKLADDKARSGASRVNYQRKWR